MRSRSTIGTLVATLVLVAGCSGTDDAPAVAWTDNVCAALARFTKAASTRPAVDMADPVATARGMGSYLGSTATALQDTIRGLDAAGPSPVSGGDDYVGRLKTTLTSIRTTFETAGGQLADLDTKNPAKVASALPGVLAPLQELSKLPDPTEGLESIDALRSATEKAPHCIQLRTG